MKVRKAIEELEESIEALQKLADRFPDLHVERNQYGYGYDYFSKSAYVTDFESDSMYVSFYQKVDDITKIYSKPSTFGHSTDEYYPCYEWIDEAMKANITPSILLKAIEKIYGKYYVSEKEFKEKFAKYNDKWWDK